MPITPRYNLTQTSTHVHIEVSIPHVRVSTSTLDLVIVDGTELHLYAPPTYLLKLTLPGRVLDEDAVETSLAACAAATTTTSGGSNVVVAVVGDDDNCIENGKGCSTTNEESTIPNYTNANQIIWTKEDLPKLQYNPEKNHGTLVVILRKEEDDYWQDLDLLGRLQQPTHNQREKMLQATTSTRTTTTKNPLVQEVGIDDDCKEEEAVEEATANNESASTTEVMGDLLSINQKRSPTYGLFQHFSNVFRDYAREGLAHEMLECPNPDEVYDNNNGENNDNDTLEMEQQQNRREMRLEMENEKFDADRYLSDLYVEEEGDMIFDSAMMMTPHWMMETTTTATSSSSSSLQTNSNDGSSVVETITDQLSKLSTTSDNDNNEVAPFFTSEESHLLATLPYQKNSPDQQLLLTAEQKRAAFLSLTDIFFAYAYDHRTTYGESTVESSWTVMILSPSLSWLENYNPPYDTLVDVLRYNIRRSLIYPYLRSYTLSTKIVVEDVCRILLGGRRMILRCLLQVHRIMEKSESHYLFNKMYVHPLIGWIQRCEEDEV
ncbi:hypothetical protein ACHAXR_002041, partial [Thalassiosira sp. AJA248-18]